MGRTVYCANCGKQLDSDYASTFVGEPGYYCGSSCLREFQKKHAANAESYKSYTDMFGNKVRIVGSTGEFEVKTGFWGWTTASFKGKVEYRYPNGDLYVGEVHGQSFNGKGKMFWKSTGNTYEGDWVYDYRSGKGRFTWANGNYYEGDFVSDKRTGKGRYVWASGCYYEGDFVDGNFNGYGKRVYIDGYQYVGEFKDDKRHGKGVLTAPDGTAIEYYYENDKIVGNTGVTISPTIAKAPVNSKLKTTATTATETKKAADTSTVKKVEVAAPADQPPKLVEESFEGLSDQEIWDRLLTMSADEKKAYFKAHHELTIPEGTEVIPANCFHLCFGLKKINFNEELREIGERAFTGARIDSVLVIPKSVENIGKHAFDMCRSIEKLVLPNNITVADYAFGFTNALAEVEFETEPPQGVVLGTGVFAHCDKHAMTSKEMIKKIKALNKKAFK